MACGIFSDFPGKSWKPLKKKWLGVNYIYRSLILILKYIDARNEELWALLERNREMAGTVGCQALVNAGTFEAPKVKQPASLPSGITQPAECWQVQGAGIKGLSHNYDSSHVHREIYSFQSTVCTSMISFNPHHKPKRLLSSR